MSESSATGAGRKVEVSRLDVLTSSRVSSYLLIGMVSIVFASGFINLLPTGRTYAATVIVDLACVVLFVLALISALRQRLRLSPWIWGLGGLFAVYVVLLFHGGESWVTRLTSLRSNLLYAIVGVYAAVTLRRLGDIARVLRVVYAAGVLFAVFGLFQFLFRTWLPEWVLITRDTPAFSYYGTDIVRSTGLLGNTIIYANLMVLFVALFAFRSIANPTWRNLLATALVLGAVVVTFSRLAIVAGVVIVVVALVAWVVRNWSRRLGWILGSVLAGAALVAGTVWWIPSLRRVITDSFIVKGLFLGQNATVQGSTDGHNAFTDTAGALLAGPSRWFGVGIGTQSQHSVYAEHHHVITDGALLATLVEGGILLAVAYGVALALCIVALLTAYRKVSTTFRPFIAAMVVYSAYLFAVAALFNSAYFGKVLFITYWLLFGVAMALSTTASKGHPIPRVRGD